MSASARGGLAARLFGGTAAGASPSHTELVEVRLGLRGGEIMCAFGTWWRLRQAQPDFCWAVTTCLREVEKSGYANVGFLHDFAVGELMSEHRPTRCVANGAAPDLDRQVSGLPLDRPRNPTSVPAPVDRQVSGLPSFLVARTFVRVSGPLRSAPLLVSVALPVYAFAWRDFIVRGRHACLPAIPAPLNPNLDSQSQFMHIDANRCSHIQQTLSGEFR